ncbi:hypothetical protein LGQ02_02820 [Bacillus shivajii]|uniref:hypothetical protein n=1 Tax=Bacillus shivajii TaxID=1983719 RepID=UPI001CFBFDD4|nr:hypothetical protein [Bacillus shivajii]UCZ53737.1 hypothetical protein LGQ02_02820 [Bacillus shivajii]
MIFKRIAKMIKRTEGQKLVVKEKLKWRKQYRFQTSASPLSRNPVNMLQNKGAGELIRRVIDMATPNKGGKQVGKVDHVREVVALHKEKEKSTMHSPRWWHVYDV